MATQTYKVEAPDGQIITLEGPAGADQKTVIAQAQKLYAERQQQAAMMPEASADSVPAVPQERNEDIPVLDENGRLVDMRPDTPERSALDVGAQAVEDYLGRGETALALATGLTGGAVGMIGGTIKGIIDEMAVGDFGTQEAADRIEKAASEAGAALTYAPRTESGQRQTKAVGEALAPLAALGPMVSEGAALAQGIKNLPAMTRAALPAKATAATARIEPELGAPAAAAKAIPEAAVPAQDAGVWTWNSAGKEHPVDILPQTYTTPEGKLYQRVLYQGKETFVAADDLVPPAATATEPVAASQAAPAASKVEPAIAGESIEPPVGAQSIPTSQQASEGVAKSIAEAIQASKKKQIPTMERLASEVQPDETILQAADRLGIRDQLIPSQYSRSQAYREIEQGLASIPGSQLNAQQKQAAAMLAQKADDLIQQYGGDIDKAALSSEFRTKGLATIDDLTRQSDDLYSKVNKAIPLTTKITADSTIGYLTNKAKELGGADALSPIERRTLTMLSGGTRRAGVDPNSAESLASYGQARSYERILPTYARVDQLRKQVGEGLRGRGVFKDAESGSLKQLYARLSDDQQAAANSLGAGELFSAAKQLVGTRKAIEDDLAAVLGKDLSGAITAKTGLAIKGLSSGNYKEFDKVMASVPKEMQQRVVMTALNDAFTSGSRMEKQLSAPGFVDWYEGLRRNTAARDRLYRYMPPEARSTLDDIAKVAKGMRDANKERITTGRVNALLEPFAQPGGTLAKLWGIGKQVAVAEGVGTAAGVPGAGAAGVVARGLSKDKVPLMKAADDLLASPQFKSALNEYIRSTGNPKRQASAEARLTKTKVYQEWFKRLPPASKAAIRSNGAIGWLTQPVGDVSDSEPSK